MGEGRVGTIGVEEKLQMTRVRACSRCNAARPHIMPHVIELRFVPGVCVGGEDGVENVSVEGQRATR